MFALTSVIAHATACDNRYAVAIEDYGAAVVRFRRATKLDPASTQSWYQLANSLMQTAGGTSASRPPSSTAPSTRTTSALFLSPLDEAADAYEHVLTLDTTLASAHLEYGILLSRLGRINDAHTHLEEAARLNSDLAPAAQQILSSFASRSDL
jgi:tetratricopeptide (TPR) repeat protein